MKIKVAKSKMKCTINPKFSELTPFIKDFYLRFSESSDVLQNARNETKVVSLGQSDYAERVVIKSFKVPNAFNRVIYSFLRKSKARRSYEYSLLLNSYAPEPVAYIEESKAGLIKNSYFICSLFDYDFELFDVINDAEFPDRVNIYKAFALFTHHLHEMGIYHEDYSWKNILVKRVQKGYEFKVVDLNRMSFGKLSLKRRMRAFARLSLNDLDIEIIASEYANIVSEQPSNLVVMAKSYRDRFVRNRLLKNRLRGRA